MKSRRAVCSPTHAGYIEYKGLPGRVRSGCQNTPTQDSSFCALHKPTLAMPQKVDSPDFGSSTTVNTEKEPVGIIVNKREFHFVSGIHAVIICLAFRSHLSVYSREL